MLQDIRLDLDSVRRIAAIESSSELLKKVKAREGVPNFV
jgi:hypothetical protein